LPYADISDFSECTIFPTPRILPFRSPARQCRNNQALQDGFPKIEHTVEFKQLIYLRKAAVFSKHSHSSTSLLETASLIRGGSRDLQQL
jgi:hypothetical protein